MTAYYNMSGTTSTSFKIGKGGPTLNQGSYTPSANELSPYYVKANAGDLFIRTGSSPAIFVFNNNNWLEKSDWLQNGTTAYTYSNVGIGVNNASPNSALSVNGNVNILGSSSGIYFPDGSFQDKSASASAAGSAGQIQYNDGTGQFAASPDLIYDNLNTRFGIGTNAPFGTLQFKYTVLESATSELYDLTTTIIDTFKVPEIRSAHYYIQITDETTSEYQVTQITVVHDGLKAYKSEYNILCSGPKLGDFDVFVQGLDVNLFFTPFSSTHKTMKVNRSSMTI